MKKRLELARVARHDRIRKRLSGTAVRPRLSIYRSLKNIYAQLVDDVAKHTLLSVSSQDKEIKKSCAYGGNVKAAEVLGEVLAKKAKLKGINKVVFDRGGYLYHGRVKAVADGARKAGLEF